MGDLATMENGRGAGLGLPMVTAPPSPAEWSALKQQASVIARSGLAPKAVSTPEKVLVIAMKGRELSIPPMQALSHIHIVEGKPTLSAELMTALVRRAGHKLRVVEWSDEGCVIEGMRLDDPGHWQRTSFTAEDARRAGLLGKQVWKNYLQSMLFSRCTSKHCRSQFADVLMGASYTPEELGAEVNEEGEVLSVPDQQGASPGEAVQRDSSPAEDAELVEEAPRASSKQAGYLKGLMREMGVDRAAVEERYGPVEDLPADKANKWIDELESRKRAKAAPEAPAAEAPSADEEEEEVPDFEDMRGADRDAVEDRRQSDPYERLRDLLDTAYADRSDREFGHEWYERARLAGAPIGTLSTTEVLDLIREMEDGGHDAE